MKLGHTHHYKKGIINPVPNLVFDMKNTEAGVGYTLSPSQPADLTLVWCSSQTSGLSYCWSFFYHPLLLSSPEKKLQTPTTLSSMVTGGMAWSGKPKSKSRSAVYIFCAYYPSSLSHNCNVVMVIPERLFTQVQAQVYFVFRSKWSLMFCTLITLWCPCAL